MATALGLQILQPSYPFLVTPGAMPYSFPNTDPFGFSSATYFIPLSGLIKGAITSSFIGNLSDRIGRRPCFLVCLSMSTVTAIIQYFARETFWGYCGATFANGLFAASITKIDPPSNGSMWGFIVTLYGIFPMTVLSQLSTGPMFDMLAPVHQRGFAQELNMTIMNFTMALSPWMLGVMADEVGAEETIWLCVGASVFAALVNSPLMFAPELKRKPPVDYQKAMGLGGR